MNRNSELHTVLITLVAALLTLMLLRQLRLYRVQIEFRQERGPLLKAV